MFNTGIMENAKQGMICLLEDDVGEIVSDTATVDYLERGTPVKIVDVKKEALPIAEWEDPRFRCTLVVEDSKGKQWNIHDPNGDFSVCVLEEGDSEHLLSDTGYMNYKTAKWTDNGNFHYFFPSALLPIVLGCLCLLFTDEDFCSHLGITLNALLPVWKILLYTVCVVVSAYGYIRIFIGNKISNNPLTRGEMWFYRNYARTSLELRELLNEYQARHR